MELMEIIKTQVLPDERKDDIFCALHLFQCENQSEIQNLIFNSACVYQLGRIDGIRQERARRKRKQKLN